MRRMAANIQLQTAAAGSIGKKPTFTLARPRVCL